MVEDGDEAGEQESGRQLWRPLLLLSHLVTQDRIGDPIQYKLGMPLQKLLVLSGDASALSGLVAPSQDLGMLVLPKDVTPFILICHDMHPGCGCITGAIEGCVPGYVVFSNHILLPSSKNRHLLAPITRC
jgi:hypothetical protein